MVDSVFSFFLDGWLKANTARFRHMHKCFLALFLKPFLEHDGIRRKLLVDPKIPVTILIHAVELGGSLLTF